MECLLYVHGSGNRFQKHLSVHGHNTRFKDKYVPSLHRLEKTRNMHIYNSLKLYNKLPDSLTSLHYNAFKKKIKSLLKENVFYSMDEFLSHKF